MLFLKELKKTTLSIAWFIVIVTIFFMVNSQGVLKYTLDDRIAEPLPGKEDYGYTVTDDKDVIMDKALNSLYGEYKRNSYTTYPVGFYKEVRLSEKEQSDIAMILSYFTGISLEVIEQSANLDSNDNLNARSYYYNEDGTLSIKDNIDEENTFVISVLDDIDYHEFKAKMSKVNRILGTGSSYSISSLNSFGFVSKTYEEAINEYNTYVKDGNIASIYARYFNDYATLMLSILPVFLAVNLCLKDKRGQIADLLYTRSISSYKLILIRYIVMVTSVIIPTLLLSYVSSASVWGLYPERSIDYLASFKYTFGWGLPSVMISVSLGMFLTELTKTPIAILVQGLWWFFDANTGLKTGNQYAMLNLSPRHNSLWNGQLFTIRYESLIWNRISFVVLSILLVVFTVIIYERRRRGRVHEFKLREKFNNNKK